MHTLHLRKTSVPFDARYSQIVTLIIDDSSRGKSLKYKSLYLIEKLQKQNKFRKL